jgi:hypothetical protein
VNLPYEELGGREAPKEGLTSDRSSLDLSSVRLQTVKESIVCIRICRDIPEVRDLAFIIERQKVHFVHVQGGSVGPTAGFVKVEHSVAFVCENCRYVELLGARVVSNAPTSAAVMASTPL